MNLIKPIFLISVLEKKLRQLAAWQYIVLFILPVSGIAQTQKEVPTGNELFSISEKKLSDTELATFNRLATMVQAASYYQNDVQKDFGSDPVCFITDVQSMASGNAQFTGPDIEMVIIKVTAFEDVGKKIDLARFSSFAKLRYIYILSEVTISKYAINEMLKNQAPSWIVVYTISKPS